MLDILRVHNKIIGRYSTPSPPHKHQKWELVIFEKGEAKNYVNSVPYDANTGSAFLLGPMHVHAIQLMKPDHLHKDIYLEQSDVEELLKNYPQDLRDNVLSGKTFIHLTLEPLDFNSIIKSVHNVEKLLFAPNTQNYEKFKPLTLSIASYLLNIYLINVYSQKNAYPEWLLSFLRKLSTPEYFSQDVTSLIRETNYSHTQFSKLFKKYCGCSLIDYLKILRLSHAAVLLTESDYSTLFICETCGYDSYSYFERIFKEKFKCTPQQYRKQKRDTPVL